MNKFFDRFAERTSRFVARAPFFAACVAIILLWAFAGPFAGFSEVWQLIINTATTIITFLLVALLQNSQQRFEDTVHFKLNAIARAMSDIMEEQGMESDRLELQEAIGLEDRMTKKEK